MGINVNVHIELVLDHEILYEELQTRINELLDQLAHPEQVAVEYKACDAEECFDKSCDMRQPWSVK